MAEKRHAGFQRKGAHPAVVVAVGLRKEAPMKGSANDATGQDTGEDEGNEGREAEPTERYGTHELSACPKCGSVFHDPTGVVIPEGHPDHPGTASHDPSRETDTGEQIEDVGPHNESPAVQGA